MAKLFAWLAVFVSLLSSSTYVSAAQQKVTYCIDPDWAPYESIEQGNHIGVSAQYLKLISQYSNLSFELYPTQTWQESIEAIKKGLCQFIPLLNESEERKAYLEFSDDYFGAANVLFGVKETVLPTGFASLTNETVAVVKDYRMHHYLKRHYPELNLVPVLNEKSGLAALNKGEADYFVGSFYSANRIIHQLGLPDIHIVAIADLGDKLRMGFNKDFSSLLPTINKAIAQLTPENHHAVLQELHQTTIVSKTDYTLAWRIAFIALLIFALIATKHFATLKQQRALSIKNKALERMRVSLEEKNNQLAELSVRDHLTHLHNRLYLNEQIESNIRLKRRYDTPCCLIVIDIDDFKHFNDHYGHKVGDDVLKTLASVLKSVVRDTDVCARWGGEEFAILCPASVLDDAIALSRRFQQALSNENNQLPQAITCSIGIAELSKQESESQWFNNADNAMYAAKAKGKNCLHINDDTSLL